MLNVVALVGRLTADPELKYTPNNVAVTSFSLAVTRSYAKAGEERQTDFIDLVAWRNTAEFISRYFRKGQLIAVEGSIQTRTYEDKEGKKRKVFEVVVNNAHFTESKKTAEAANASARQSDVLEESEASYKSGSAEDFQEIQSDDDLPF